ncbi:MAG: ribosome small subunit-dependent GTPase A [Planctomycetota bacterium]|nr:ribosome small subunit-dependent GTPase A [Planctomycetota bacterium]MEC8337124.1 ribosome small subunit-dependent GTPase A [Planctomycetota bacterium]
MSKKKKKLRVSFRKNRQARTREGGLTQKFEREGFEDDDSVRREQISGKGELAKKRTVIGQEVSGDNTGFSVLPEVDLEHCLSGRVLEVRGLISVVQTSEGKRYDCAVRRLLKTLQTDQRHVVAVGDEVQFKPDGDEGLIERIEPRRGVLARTSRDRQHVLVANVEKMVIVASAAEPDLKPHLIDRFLVAAEQAQIIPVICINKIDLVDPGSLQPLIGVYAQLGYEVLQVSATAGLNLPRLRSALRDRATVVVGQSGVGKSSLLNAIEPDLGLRVGAVSRETRKGRHTTTTARLIPLSMGGFIVDTPGIRQFALWDVAPQEVAGLFRDIRPLVSYCRFPDCTHTHEADCAVKDSVGDGRLDARRYESYCHMRLDGTT